MNSADSFESSGIDQLDNAGLACGQEKRFRMLAVRIEQVATAVSVTNRNTGIRFRQ